MAWKKGPFKTTREQREEFRNSVDAASLAWFFFAAIGLGYLAGAWVDRRFGVTPWGSVLGACFGIAAGFVNLVQVANRINRDEEEAARRKREQEKKP